MRSVGEYCSRKVVTARPDDSLLKVAQRMRQEHVGSVVVIRPSEDGRAEPVGIVTDRDIVVRVLAQTDRHLEQVRADDIMARPVLTVDESDDLAEALSSLQLAGVRRLPVVDATGSLVGLLSIDDLICHMQGSLGQFAELLRRERQDEMSALR